MACAIGNDICVYMGDTYTTTFTVTDGTNPIDITGYNITSVKKALGDSTTVFTKTATLSDPVNGEAVLQLTDTDTDLEAFNYYYDIEFRNSDSSIVKTYQARFEIKKDIA